MSVGSAYTFIMLLLGFPLFLWGLIAELSHLMSFLHQFQSLGIPSLPSLLKGKQKKYF